MKSTKKTTAISPCCDAQMVIKGNSMSHFCKDCRKEYSEYTFFAEEKEVIWRPFEHGQVIPFLGKVVRKSLGEDVKEYKITYDLNGKMKSRLLHNHFCNIH